MLTYDIGKKGNMPLYIYLYQCIKSDIENGEIRSGEKLPSKRNLAEHLNISVMTVQNAYAQLLAEGYLYSREKSGYFAADLDKGFNTPVPTGKKIPGLGVKGVPDMGDNGIPGFDERPATYFIDFCANSIHEKSFPYSIWSKQMREVLCEKDSDLLRKMPNSGVLKLRRAIADFLHHFRGMTVSPDQIVIGAGTEYLYGLLIKLLGKDKIYAVEDPGYRKISEIYKIEGADYKYINMDFCGISIDEVYRSKADIVHVSPSHHFPTGIVMPVKRRRELLRWANEAPARFIIEDEYDSEFRFTGKSVPTLQSIDENEKVIYVNTFSKTISPAIRISYMVLPVSLLKNYRETLRFYSCTVSSLEQFALAKFIEKGYFERHINRMRKFYKTQRDFVIKTIKSSCLGEKIKIFEEDSGLHFIVKIDTGLSDETLTREAQKRGINMSFLSQYFARQDRIEKSMLILNYSGIDIKNVEHAVNILSDILQTE